MCLNKLAVLSPFELQSTSIDELQANSVGGVNRLFLKDS